MSTNHVTPAQRARQALIKAEHEAWILDWKNYKALEEAHRRVRFNIKEYKNHGKPSTYSHGCRCDDCKSSWADYMRERMRERRKKIRESRPPKPRPEGKQIREVKDHQHGTDTGYVYGCRCRRCTEAHRISKPRSLPEKVSHGSVWAYNKYKCRCRSCVKEKARYAKEYRRRKNNHES